MLQKCLVQVCHTSLRVCTDGMAFVSSFGDAKVNFLAGILLWHHQERKFREGGSNNRDEASSRAKANFGSCPCRSVSELCEDTFSI